jgi:Protein of unknown function (DUF2950)
MTSKLLSITVRILLSTVTCTFAIRAHAQSQPPESKPSSSPQATAQESFATPEKAAQALIKAAGEYDVPALLRIFGPHGEDLVSSADPVRDKSNALAFAEKARQKQSVSIDPVHPSRAILMVGNDKWPAPIPIEKKGGKWFFDSKAGREEILRRRIGANELDAIQVCRGFVEAQEDYATQQHDGINQYAQKIISSPGKQDGLYWQNADGTPGGPISGPVARAIAEGYSTDKPTVYHGYYFKILKGQGPAAPLGRIDYVIEGVMIGGFALVAVPAEYRITGVKTFIVSNYGVVYEKDLGPNSLEIVRNMELYNPDKTWRVTNDQWPETALTATGVPTGDD